MPLVSGGIRFRHCGEGCRVVEQVLLGARVPQRRRRADLGRNGARLHVVDEQHLDVEQVGRLVLGVEHDGRLGRNADDQVGGVGVDGQPHARRKVEIQRPQFRPK